MIHNSKTTFPLKLIKRIYIFPKGPRGHLRSVTALQMIKLWIEHLPTFVLMYRIAIVIGDLIEFWKFDTQDHLFWCTRTQGFPKIYHMYSVPWIFEKPNQPQNLRVETLIWFGIFLYLTPGIIIFDVFVNRTFRKYTTYMVFREFLKKPTNTRIWSWDTYRILDIF